MALMAITKNVKYFSMLGIWFFTLIDIWFLAKMIDIFLSEDSKILLVAVSIKMKLVSISNFILELIGVAKYTLYVISPLMRSICVSISDTRSVNSFTLLIITVSPSLDNANVPSKSQMERFNCSSFRIK
ncbi:hypothetical protein pCPXV0119 [Cowpox virus]|uniref:Uncharacterized protein n=1 Tax=Cowpox virus TaxID=10243 RepID=A0A212PPT1_COWPX|nr:hypothetical protein pCPXV0119 [Cowpox virus]SNB48926.1 hypothetical protein pCPXV0119 [Cowpox virus]